MVGPCCHRPFRRSLPCPGDVTAREHVDRRPKYNFTKARRFGVRTTLTTHSLRCVRERIGTDPTLHTGFTEYIPPERRGCGTGGPRSLRCSLWRIHRIPSISNSVVYRRSSPGLFERFEFLVTGVLQGLEQRHYVCTRFPACRGNSPRLEKKQGFQIFEDCVFLFSLFCQEFSSSIENKSGYSPII